MKPNYTDLGLSTIMGPQLRRLIEKQLIDDLKNYNIQIDTLKFDWSNSCIEGHDLDYLDGSVENFSGILIFDNTDKLVVEGWMEFVHGGDFFIAYWDFISVWEGKKEIVKKDQPGIPEHILKKIPDGLKF